MTSISMIGSEIISEDEAKDIMSRSKDISLLSLAILLGSLFIGIVFPLAFLVTATSAILVIVAQQHYTSARVIYHVLRMRKR